MIPAPNTNTSATGGYILPAAPTPLPGNLTFQQFLQTVFVGVSGLPPQLVRPDWQIKPPKEPDIEIDWLAFGLVKAKPDSNAFVGLDSNNVNLTIRHEELHVRCVFYGPNGYDNSGLMRDGFQLSQNREALMSAFMNFVETTEATRVPDLVNERWVDRWEMEAVFRREIMRTYPVLNFVSASGVIKSVVEGGPKTVAWNSNSEES